MTGGWETPSTALDANRCGASEPCLADAAVDRRGFVLLAGEAGVGKAHLATAATVESQLFPLGATASHTTATPFGPLISTLRAFVRTVSDGLPHDGRSGRCLPVLLPELGVDGTARSGHALRAAGRGPLWR